MVFYVTHRFKGSFANKRKAEKITQDLQQNDPENCYVCSLSNFYYANKEIAIELRKDLLTLCDKLIIASEVDEEIEAEIEFANKCKMEVVFLENIRR